MKTKHCNWCDNSFETLISYQIYCSAECREKATKEKIMERYIANRRSTDKYKERVCKSCGHRLSVYNDDEICSKCETNPKDVLKALKDIKAFLNEKD